MAENRKPNHLTGSWRAMALAIVALYLCATIALAVTSAPTSDEAMHANPSYNLAFHGRMGMTVWELRGYMPFSAADRTYWQPPLFFVAAAAWFKLVGFGLLRLRLLSILFGLICLGSWVVIVCDLISTTAALAVLALMSMDYFFLIGAAGGRMDMMCVGLGSAGLAAYIHLRRQNFRAAVVAGNSLAALAILTHPAGLVWAAAVLFAMLFFDGRRCSMKVLAAGAIPYLLAGACWGLYIIQDIPAFRGQMAASLAQAKGGLSDFGSPNNRVMRLLKQEVFYRYMGPFGLAGGVGLANRLKALVLVSYVAGILGNVVLGWRRRQAELLWFAGLPLLAFLILAEVSPSKLSYYLPHTTVLMAASLGVFLAQSNRAPRYLAVAGLCALQTAGVAYLIHKDSYRRVYLPVIDAIRQDSPPHALILGPSELWFALAPDRQVLNDHYLGLLSGNRPAMFVMDRTYRELHLRDRNQEPAAYEHVRKLIEASRLVLDNGHYQLYLPPQTAPQP